MILNSVTFLPVVFYMNLKSWSTWFPNHLCTISSPIWIQKRAEGSSRADHRDSLAIVLFTWQIRVLSPTRHFETSLSPIPCSEDSASIERYRYTILIYVSHRWRRVSLNKALDPVARRSSETLDWHQYRIHQFCYRSCSNSYHRYSPLRSLKRADIVDRWWYLPLRLHQSMGFLHSPREAAKVRVNAPEDRVTLTRCSFPFDARVVIIRWLEKR